MIGKIIAGSSFAGTVGYVTKKQSRILTAEGITPPDVREMVQDFKDAMVKTIKTGLSAKNNQLTGNDLPQQIEQIVYFEQKRHRGVITQLAGRMESIERSNAKTQSGIDNLQSSVDAIQIPAELPPRITQHRISLTIESQGVFWAMIGMMSTIVLLCTMLYWAAQPNYNRIDNDLKYRYIKNEKRSDPRTHCRTGRNFRTEPRQCQNPPNEKGCRRI